MTNENNEGLPKPILIEDLGMRYHTVSSKNKVRFGLYKCGFCGTEFKANTYTVVQGKTKSCGCYNKRRTKEANKTHNLSRSRLYRIWNNIKNRTLKPKNKYYINYGGRGITLCDEWKNDFKSFYDWSMYNGYSDELSIDRIDNDGGYSPENCRWTTKTMQSRNQRIQKNNTSGYKGVSYNKRNGNYQTYIKIKFKKIHLGTFKTAGEGAVAYNNYIIENNLEGFILNEIPQEYTEKEITNEKVNT